VPLRPRQRPPVPPAQQALPPGSSAVAFPPAPAGLASLLVADFPELFAEFRGIRFTLLWRGSPCFRAGDCHGRWDGHAPTLTLIQDTDGNTFGGFTPVELESDPTGKSKADPSLKSFLSALEDPHNFPVMKFALEAEGKDRAIYCHSW
jgi:hypothetical protein